MVMVTPSDASGLPDLHIFIISAISLPYGRRCHGTGAGAAGHSFSRSTLNDSHFDVFFSGDGYFFNGCGFDINAVFIAGQGMDQFRCLLQRKCFDIFYKENTMAVACRYILHRKAAACKICPFFLCF